MLHSRCDILAKAISVYEISVSTDKSDFMDQCYGMSRIIKKELTIYGTARPRARFANENAMDFSGQERYGWPSMAPVGHVELTKIQKLSERKNKNINKNWKQNETKNENSL